MFDILMFLLLLAAFAAAWGYVRACADLTAAPGSHDGDKTP